MVVPWRDLFSTDFGNRTGKCVNLTFKPKKEVSKWDMDKIHQGILKKLLAEARLVSKPSGVTLLSSIAAYSTKENVVFLLMLICLNRMRLARYLAEMWVLRIFQYALSTSEMMVKMGKLSIT
jgi:hypothetical protein